MIARSFRYKLLCAAALTPIAARPSAAAPAPLVDTTSASPVTSVTREQLEKLPAGRRLEDLIRTCPSNTIPTISRQPDVLIDGKPTIDLNCVQPADLDMIEVYKVHNIARAEYGAPPLVWDPALVQSSGTVAGQRVRTGTLEHSSRAGRGTVRENISQGLPWWSTRQLLENWTKEKKNFVPGIFPNVSRTNNWYDIGHWAQMIWIQTVMIGCARAAGIGSSWLVCHYDPGGNKDGKPVGIPVQTQQVASAPNT
ncbi:MAG TPA: CAP domain-containing protein, partial [Nitrobacter sp.]|nr:CAP domain-containing protein [Nitrobacter sp.]